MLAAILDTITLLVIIVGCLMLAIVLYAATHYPDDDDLGDRHARQ